MTNTDMLMILSVHELDEAGAMAWMQESSDADKLAVWMTIQKKYDDPLMELMSRFAQWGFTQLYLKCQNERTGPDE